MDSAEFLQELAAIPLTTYDNIKWIQNNVMVTKWKDKKKMYMVSTNNDGSDTDKQRLLKNSKLEEVVSVPTVIIDYNANMGGVDHADQIRSGFNLNRTGRRWWKYLMWGLFNLAVINAYILWNMSTRPPLQE